MEIMQKVAGQLAPCPGPNCGGSQPAFYLNTGSTFVHAECCRCRIRLWDCSTMQEAVEVWESLPRIPELEPAT